MWEELPQDVQLVIVWRAVRPLITHQDEEVVPWRTAERVELINRLFHSRLRAVVRMLSAIKFAYKDQRIAEQFCTSSILVANALHDDLRGTERANGMMELASAVYTMIWGRIGRMRHLELDEPNLAGFRVYDERRAAFHRHMRAALFADVLEGLRHRKQANDPNYGALVSFVGKAFAYVYKSYEPEAFSFRELLEARLA